jgi:hypothetical protein
MNGKSRPTVILGTLVIGISSAIKQDIVVSE